MFSAPISSLAVACQPIEQFPSKSAIVTDETINELFQNNKIPLVYFEYLSYINGFLNT
ncbi:hypothetical protein [Spiroplasma clarkii]|uniref:hypothetical protein n=1 Tax=Spiroplasma clarkii TaxID=2139 RepID=UPI001649DAA6|nr:hypothetical protein [Spiroplasma clarkii]